MNQNSGQVVAIIQARMGSTRLPGKVMMDLGGKPLLTQMMERVQRAKSLSEVVIATTVQPADQVLVDLCEKNHWRYFRGDEEDVLGRYHDAAHFFQADFVVRVTSDCPLMDPQLIDSVVEAMIRRQREVDLVVLRETFPRGLAIEAMPIDLLDRLNRLCTDPREREHVTSMIRRQPHLFAVHRIFNDDDLYSYRWTVDTAEDLKFVRLIYNHFGHNDFSWKQVLTLVRDHPDWCEINHPAVQKSIQKHD